MPELAGEGRVLKRFRVAREGQTVDGRFLSRQEIQQMAQSYKLSSYTARINVEHIAGYSPDPPFNAYGDVVAIEAIEEDGKFSLYNTISALPNLITLNQAGQKIYPSIEFYRDFAGSGKAYQVGLALTDTPASLGTQPLKLSQQQFALRTSPDMEICMSSTPTASAPAAPAAAEEKTLFNQLKELLTPKPVAAPAVPEDFNATVTQGLVAALNGIASLNQRFDALSAPAATAVPATSVTVTTPVTPAAPVAFATPAATPAAVPAPASDPVALLSQQVQQLTQQLQTLATTPVNAAPPQNGGAGDITPF